MRGDEQQADQVRPAHQGDYGRVGGQPAPRGGTPRIRPDDADQQVAGQDGQREHHRVGPGLLSVPAGHRQERECQPGRDTGARGHQPPADRRRAQGREGHRECRREPRSQFAEAENSHQRPHDHVVEAVDHIGVLQHPPERGRLPSHHGQGGGLVPPERGSGDAPQVHAQCRAGGQRQVPRPPPARRGALGADDRVQGLRRCRSNVTASSHVQPNPIVRGSSCAARPLTVSGPRCGSWTEH